MPAQFTNFKKVVEATPNFKKVKSKRGKGPGRLVALESSSIAIISPVFSTYMYDVMGFFPHGSFFLRDGASHSLPISYLYVPLLFIMAGS
jgi:hypothetical protein